MFAGSKYTDLLLLQSTDVVKRPMALSNPIYGKCRCAIKEEVRENKKNDTIKSFLNEGLKDKPAYAIVTDCDPNYPDIIKNSFPNILHQIFQQQFQDEIYI